MEKRNKEIVEFKFLKLWLRLLSLIVGGLILAINILAFKDGEYSIVALVVGALFFIAGLIENSWYFNITKKQAVQKKGLIFFCKKQIINFSSINSLTVETFKQPARISTFSEIYMQLLDGEKISIDRDKTKNLTDQIEAIHEIQDILNRDNEKKS